MTLESSIFRKLLLSALAVLALTLVTLDFLLVGYMARHEVESVQQRLAAMAGLLSGELAAVAPAELAEWTRRAGARAQARATLIDPRGVVLGDSEHDPGSMENHADRPEIQQALHAPWGSSVRYSHTLNRNLCYVALATSYRGESGYILRLAVPVEEISTAAVRRRILASSIAAALLALALVLLFSRSFSRRIDRLRVFAEQLVDNRFSPALALEGKDELGSLAQSLDRMATQIRDLVGKLSQESSRRQAVLGSMVEGVLAVDNSLRVTFCNDSFARLVGASTPLPEQMPLLELVRDPELLGMLKQVLVTGEASKQRMQLAGADGRSFEVQAAPAHHGAIAILHDITDLERLERVRRDFVANVSHELRTPLTAVRGYAETLLEGALEDKENNRRFLEIIKAHAIRLDHIAADLLALSELESGKAAAQPQPISVREALEAALRIVEPEARLSDVKIICGEIDDAQVLGEPLRLEQLAVNLLDNAVKFNRPGGEVRVEVHRTADGKVRLTVADTGIGIPSQDLPRIFERFYRVDKARSREVGGTGLGLSIVKHIVERMNGSVSVESQLGKGSTFTVVLPSC